MCAWGGGGGGARAGNPAHHFLGMKTPVGALGTMTVRAEPLASGQAGLHPLAAQTKQRRRAGLAGRGSPRWDRPPPPGHRRSHPPGRSYHHAPKFSLHHLSRPRGPLRTKSQCQAQQCQLRLGPHRSLEGTGLGPGPHPAPYKWAPNTARLLGVPRREDSSPPYEGQGVCVRGGGGRAGGYLHIFFHSRLPPPTAQPQIEKWGRRR